MEEKRDCAYDYAHCERVWRRVAPADNPYPGRGEEEAKQGELSLPGAQENPCCMGTAATESLAVLKGFVREELAARQTYLEFACCAPTQEMRRILRALAADEQRHARQLTAAVYLTTGEVYRPHRCPERGRCTGGCDALRQLYHEEVCSGFNYFRAGEETLDYCLSQMFAALSQDEYRHARLLLNLLSRMLRV